MIRLFKNLSEFGVKISNHLFMMYGPIIFGDNDEENIVCHFVPKRDEIEELLVQVERLAKAKKKENLFKDVSVEEFKDNLHLLSQLLIFRKDLQEIRLPRLDLSQGSKNFHRLRALQAI